MDDQNQTNQPLVPGTTPVVPSVPEDITPVAPVVAPAMEPITPPTPWNSPAEPVSMPTPSIEPAPAAEEPVMPVGKPKKKILPIIGGVLALLLVVGVAGAAYYVSNQLSTRQAVSPNAPESKPMATAENCDSSSNPTCTLDNIGASCVGPHAYGKTGVCMRVDSVANECCYIESLPTCSWEGDSCTTDSQCYTGYSEGQPCYDVVCSTDGECVGASSEGMECSDWQPGGCGAHDCPATTEREVKTCNDGSTTVWIKGDGTNGGDDCTPKTECSELVCGPNDQDTPSPKSITFPTAGTVTVYTRNMRGTLTLTSGAKVVTIQATQNPPLPAEKQATTFQVTAGETYNIEAQLAGEGPAYGWIPNKAPTTCGPVKKPGNTSTGCGENTDISAVKTLATTNLGTDSITAIQCWGDALRNFENTAIPDTTQNYDFNDFTIIYRLTPTTITPTATPTPTTTPTPTGTVGACTDLKIFKADNPRELTPDQLNSLVVGDVLRFQMLTDTNDLNGRFGVKVADANEIWLPGTIDATNKKLVKSDPYTVSTAAPYSFQAQASQTPNAQDWDTTPPDACKATGIVSPAPVGACMSMSIYKKVEGKYLLTPMTDAELQNLKVGDLLKFSVAANLNGLRARFRVTIGGVPGVWLDGTVNPDLPKQFVYTDYQVGTAGPYVFEGEVSTAP